MKRCGLRYGRAEFELGGVQICVSCKYSNQASNRAGAVERALRSSKHLNAFEIIRAHVRHEGGLDEAKRYGVESACDRLSVRKLEPRAPRNQIVDELHVARRDLAAAVSKKNRVGREQGVSALNARADTE